VKRNGEKFHIGKINIIDIIERVWDRNMGTLYLNTKYAARAILMDLT